MQQFSLSVPVPRPLRALGRNPLVRGSDRVEAVTVLIAFLICALAVPVIGTIAANVHDGLGRTYAEQARTRHSVAAHAIIDSTPTANRRNLVEAQWYDGDRVNGGTVVHSDPVAAGEEFEMWLDSAGRRTDPPAPVGRAGVDSVLIAIMALAGTCAVAWVFTRGVSAGLDRYRERQWSRGISVLLGDGRYRPRDRS